jgi:succinate dehydrogenase / fumarate reductase flavoprotein subunit
VDAYREPIEISLAAHFTMGGLWVDYELMTSIPGLYAIGECNFADHGANRLGANSLLQACVDGYFILPYTLGSYLADEIWIGKILTNTSAFDKAEKEVKDLLHKMCSINGNRTVGSYHRELGKILYDHCGLVRNETGLKVAIAAITNLREDFWKNVKIPGITNQVNAEIEKAGRVADYLELAGLMCRDALTRKESCGAHFREEYQTEDNEALRNDEDYAHVPVWEHKGAGQEPTLHQEPLKFENVTLSTRSYK